MYTQDSLFNSNELLLIKGPVFLLKHVQRSLYGISNFHHRRSHWGIELGTFRSSAQRLNNYTTDLFIILVAKGP